MRLVKYIQVIGILIAGFSLQAQNEVEALRFSRYDLTGSARYVSMGGAFGALGTDPSALSQNPAGIAMYRRNEFSFSLGFMNIDTQSDFLGNTSENSDFRGRLNNLALISTRESSSSDISRVSFGAGYNRLVNYNESYSFTGTVEGGTVLDVFLDQATGTLPGELNSYTNTALYASPAWQTYLINEVDSLGQAYTHEIPYGEVTQLKTINREGYLGEITFNAGAKLNEHIFIGAALAFPKLSFQEQIKYNETPQGDSLELDYFTMYENTEATGSGANFKIGIIGKVNDWIRVGAAYHTRSSIQVDQQKDTRFESSFLNGSENYTENSKIIDYTYTLKTPARVQLNTAFIFKKKGLLAIDYERINYGNAKLNNIEIDDYNFDLENGIIDEIYKSTNNLKIGAEWRVAKPLALRAGVNYQESPYVSEATEIDAEKITYSAGFGYRSKGIYFDIAYSLSSTKSEHYSYNNIEAAQLDNTVGQTVFSLGFRY